MLRDNWDLQDKNTVFREQKAEEQIISFRSRAVHWEMEIYLWIHSPTQSSIDVLPFDRVVFPSGHWIQARTSAGRYQPNQHSLHSPVANETAEPSGQPALRGKKNEYVLKLCVPFESICAHFFLFATRKNLTDDITRLSFKARVSTVTSAFWANSSVFTRIGVTRICKRASENLKLLHKNGFPCCTYFLTLFGGNILPSVSQVAPWKPVPLQSQVPSKHSPPFAQGLGSQGSAHWQKVSIFSVRFISLEEHRPCHSNFSKAQQRGK